MKYKELNPDQRIVFFKALGIFLLIFLPPVILYLFLWLEPAKDTMEFMIGYNNGRLTELIYDKYGDYFIIIYHSGGMLMPLFLWVYISKFIYEPILKKYLGTQKEIFGYK